MSIERPTIAASLRVGFFGALGGTIARVTQPDCGTVAQIAVNAGEILLLAALLWYVIQTARAWRSPES